MTSTLPVYQWQPTTGEVAARAGVPVDRVARFDQNTSPEAPPWVAEVLEHHAGSLNEYPGADYRDLRRAVAAAHGIADERRVVVGAGADELILLVAKAWLGRGKLAVADTPAYAMYRIATLQLGAEFVGVPRPLPSLEFPTEQVAKAAASADVTWLCVPHNPVGDVLDAAAIARVARPGRPTVIDAAYAEFAGISRTDLLEAGDDVVVLGTLSKAYGLAGVRVGFALASPDHAARIDAVRPPGSISTISAALARRALEDHGWMEANVARIVAERDALAGRLSTLGLTVRPSAVNFLLVPVGERAHPVADRLMDGFGLVVRTFPEGHSLADHLRITVRDPESHDRLIDALERVL